MGRCQLSGSVTVLRRCVSWLGGVMVLGRRKGDWGGVTVYRKCDSHQGGVKGVENECQLM